MSVTAVTYLESVMKRRRSCVMTTMAALPTKLVSQVIFGRAKTTRASTPASAIADRTDAWRRLSRSDGACGMDGLEPALECAEGGAIAGAGGVRRGGRGERLTGIGDAAFQVRVVRGQRQGDGVMWQRLGGPTLLSQRVGEAARGRKVVGGGGQYLAQFDDRLVEPAERQQRAAQRDAGRDIFRVNGET